MDKKFRKELKSYGYMQLTKPLVKELGLNDATFLCILIDAHDYWLQINRLRSDGSFYYTFESIRKDWGMTPYAQKKAIDNLVELGLIEFKKPSGTDKWYFQIHIENIKKFLDSDETETIGPNESNGSYRKHPIKSVGHVPMDSTGQTPSIHGVNKNIEQNHIEKEQIGKQELLQSEIESSSPGSLRAPKGSASVDTPSGGSNETSPDTHDEMVDKIIKAMVEGQEEYNASKCDNLVDTEFENLPRVIDMDELLAISKLAEGREVKQSQGSENPILPSGEKLLPPAAFRGSLGSADLDQDAKLCFGKLEIYSGDACNYCHDYAHCRIATDNRLSVKGLDAA